MSAYTIERLTSLNQIDVELSQFLIEHAERVSRMYGSIFDWRQFDFITYMKHANFWLCRRHGHPVGVMLARLYPSIFDPSIKILMQDLLYVRPGYPKATHLLMRQFVDFGRLNANHIFTMTAEKTNIKSRSMARLGFRQSEILYMMDGDNGQGRAKN
jgi:hypothetical protein